MLSKETQLSCVIRIQGSFKIRSCLLFSYWSMLKILLFSILYNRNFGLRETSHGGGGLITIFKPTLWEVKKAETGVGMETSNQGELFSHALFLFPGPSLPSLPSAPWLQPPNPMVWTWSIPASFHLRVIALALSLPEIITLAPDSHGSRLHFLTSFRSLLQGCFLSEAFTDHLSWWCTPVPHSLYPTLSFSNMNDLEHT